MSLRAKQVSGWSTAIVIIVVASLVPVAWIVFLSLKTPATATDGSFIPHQWTLSNYSDIFSQSVLRVTRWMLRFEMSFQLQALGQGIGQKKSW